jgi:hypothetical protein
VVELWDWTLQAADAFDGEAHPRDTIELLFVLDGLLALRVGDECPAARPWGSSLVTYR